MSRGCCYGTDLGARAANRMKSTTLRRVLVAMVTSMAGYMAWRAFAAVWYPVAMSGEVAMKESAWFEALALLVIAIVAVAVAVFGGLGEVTRW